MRSILIKFVIVLSALAGVVLFVIIFALTVWVQEYPNSGPVYYTGFNESSFADRKQSTVFISPNVFISFSDNTSEISYFLLEEPLISDSLRVYSRKSEMMVDGYVAYGVKPFDHDSVKTISSTLWRSLISNTASSNFSRWELMVLSHSIRATSFIDNPEQHFYENAIEDEALKIGVYNGTLISGLALEAAQWIENVGGDVVEIGNATHKKEKTDIVVYSDLHGSPTVLRLLEIFDVSEAYYEGVSQPTRFDIIVTVGDSFYRQ